MTSLIQRKKFTVYYLIGLGSLIFSISAGSILSGCTRNPDVKRQKYLQNGIKYFNESNHKAAIIEFKNALKIDPNASEANYYLGKCYLATAKLDQALQSLDRALKSDPDLLEARLDKASIHLIKKQMRESSQEIEYVLNKDPNNSRAYQVRGNIHLFHKNPGKAYQDFKKSISLDQKSLEPRLNLARLYVMNKNYKRAKAEISEMLRIDNKSLQARLMLAELHTKDNLLDEAMKEFELIISQHPETMEGYLGLADLYYKTKKIAELEAMAGKMIEKDPSFHLAKLFLGVAAVYQGEYQKAITDLREVMKHFPHNSLAHYNLGIAYYAVGNFQQAISEYQEALKIQADSIPSMAALAMTNLEKGWYDECLKACHQMLQLAPEDRVALCISELARLKKYSISSHHVMAVISYYDNDFDKAVPEINKILEGETDDPFAHGLLGNILLARKGLNEAAAHFEESLRIEPAFISSYKGLTMISLLKKDFPVAISYLQKILTLEPASDEIHREMAVIYAKQGKIDETVSHLREAITLSPQSMKTYVMLSDFYQRLGQSDQAVATLQEASKSKPSEPAPYLALGKLYANLGNLTEAMAAYKKAIELSPEPDKQHSLVGLLYLATGEPEMALATFELILEQDSENLDALLGLAVIQGLKGNFSRAEEYIDEAILIDHGHHLAYFLQANIYASQGEYQKAKKAFQESTLSIPELRAGEIDIADSYQSNPQLIGSSLPLMAIYMNQRWYDKALEEGGKILEKVPGHALTGYLMGQTYLGKNAPTKAIPYLEGALKASPNLHSVHKFLGDIYLKQSTRRKSDQTQREQHLQKSMAEYEAYLQHYRSDANMHMKLALLYEKRNNYDQAVNHYQAILSLDPNAAIPLNQLAWLYADRNSHLDEALKYARKAAELDPGNGNILDTLGWVYFKRGDYGEALRHFEKAVRLNKSHPSIYYHLALAYDKNNKREEAINALKTSLDISSNFPEAKEAKELLEKWP